LGAETLTTPAKAAQTVAQLYSSHFSLPENDLVERRTLLRDRSDLDSQGVHSPNGEPEDMLNLHIASGVTVLGVSARYSVEELPV
jgi:hypothetical protein